MGDRTGFVKRLTRPWSGAAASPATSPKTASKLSRLWRQTWRHEGPNNRGGHLQPAALSPSEHVEGQIALLTLKTGTALVPPWLWLTPLISWSPVS
jgi:hypothetical protein